MSDTMTHSDEVSELLPCPFCGGEGAYQTDTEEESFAEEWIGCLECGATTALEVWNRRSASNTAGGGVRDEIASLVAQHTPSGLPRAYGNCTCSCHRQPGVMHIAPCCRPGDDATKPLITREWFERRSRAEDGLDISVGPVSALEPIQAGGDEPVAWRPMKDAPRGFPVVVKQGQWIATVILNPPSDEGHWTDGDSVIHYNGNVLVSGFHGNYEGWLPAGSEIPSATPVSAEVTEALTFYADPSNWKDGRPCDSWDDDGGTVYATDDGDKARAALATLDRGRG